MEGLQAARKKVLGYASNAKVRMGIGNPTGGRGSSTNSSSPQTSLFENNDTDNIGFVPAIDSRVSKLPGLGSTPLGVDSRMGNGNPGISNVSSDTILEVAHAKIN